MQCTEQRPGEDPGRRRPPARQGKRSWKTRTLLTPELGFYLPEPWENKRLLFKPSVWYYVMVALASQYVRLNQSTWRKANDQLWCSPRPRWFSVTVITLTRQPSTRYWGASVEQGSAICFSFYKDLHHPLCFTVFTTMVNFTYRLYVLMSILWLSYYRFPHKTKLCECRDHAFFCLPVKTQQLAQWQPVTWSNSMFIPWIHEWMHRWMHAYRSLNDRLGAGDLREDSRILDNSHEGIMAWTIKVKKEQNQKSLENTSWIGEGVDLPRESHASFLIPNLVHIWPTSRLCK